MLLTISLSWLLRRQPDECDLVPSFAGFAPGMSDVPDPKRYRKASDSDHREANLEPERRSILKQSHRECDTR